MGWLLRLLASPFAAIGKLLAQIGRWVLEDARHLAIFILLVVLAVFAGGWRAASTDRDAYQASAAEWERRADAWKDAHALLVAQVQAAQAAAAEADRKNAARVEREFAVANERIADAYQDRLDDTRAAYQRVREQLADIAARDPGDGGAAAVPQPLTARCQAVGAADCYALLAALPDRLAAAEDNTGKLIGLQDYVRSMLAIDFSGETPGEVE